MVVVRLDGEPDRRDVAAGSMTCMCGHSRVFQDLGAIRGMRGARATVASQQMARCHYGSIALSNLRCYHKPGGTTTNRGKMGKRLQRTLSSKEYNRDSSLFVASRWLAYRS